MSLVTLTRCERREARLVASQLSAHHAKTTLETIKTISGIYAEYAAIKYFNYEMGASPRIKFNTEYNNGGGDGGVDFSFPDEKCTWDVKSTNKATFTKEYLQKTKAKFIIGVINGDQTFSVVGFVPVSQLAKLPDQVELSYFHPLRGLTEIFPNNFFGKCVKQNTSEPEAVGSLLGDALFMIRLREQAIKEGVRDE